MTDKEVQEQASSFKYILKCIIGDDEAWKLLNFIAQNNQVYIFSGVIRDFLTGMFGTVRDVDIVLQNTNHLGLILERLKNVEIKRNSFGGLKLKYKHLCFDVWGMGETWNIKQNNLKSNPYILINTVFFNFSAIVFDFQKERFIYRQEFLKFLNTNQMDIISSINPNEPLCIINTLYYRDKYGFSISDRLVKWIKKKYNSAMPFAKVQQSHFGEIYYSSVRIKQLIENL